MISEVLSQLFCDVQVFRDVCYEWEEVLAKSFDVPLRRILIQLPPSKTLSGLQLLKTAIKPVLLKWLPFLKNIRDALRRDKYLTQKIDKPLSLCFLMFPHESNICKMANCLPIFLDVWRTNGGIKYVAEKTKKLKIFYVTSRDVYHAVLAIDSKSQVKYMPLSVADTYYSPNFEKYRKKTIDVVQFGRANYVLHEYMLRYVQEHEDIEYIYSGTGRSAGEYISTRRGSIGKILGRCEFIQLLSTAKVSLVSSPGYENSKDYAQGIHFVTPRFYESAILGCALLGRYPDNEEFRELKISRYCPNITSYEHFCTELERALTQSPEELYAQNHDFIINSLTSRRAAQIQHDLESLS